MYFKLGLVSALLGLLAVLAATAASPASADEQQQTAVRGSVAAIVETYVGKTCEGYWKITDSDGGRLNGRTGAMSFIVDFVQGNKVSGRVLPGTKTPLPTPHEFHGEIAGDFAETKTDYGGMDFVFHEDNTVTGTASVKRDRRFNQARVELKLEHMTCALADNQ